MIRGYGLDEGDIEILTPIIEGIVWRLECGDIDDIELSVINLGPSQFIELLEKIGYIRDEDWDTNGWEQDTWYYFKQEGHCSLCLHYCGYYGEIKLFLSESDE